MYLPILILSLFIAYKYRLIVGLTIYPYYVKGSKIITHIVQTVRTLQKLQVKGGKIIVASEDQDSHDPQITRNTKNLYIRPIQCLTDGKYYGWLFLDELGEPHLRYIWYMYTKDVKLELFKAKASCGVLIKDKYFTNLEIDRFYDIQIPDGF